MRGDPPLTPQDTLDRIFAEIHASPPLAAQIVFNWRGDAQQREAFVGRLMFLAHQLRENWPWLDFSALRYVIVDNDYLEGLRTLQTETSAELGFTSEPGTHSRILLVHHPLGPTLLVDHEIAVGLLDDARLDVAGERVCHMLCHAHDIPRRYLAWANAPRSALQSLLSRHFMRHAEALWSEYFASRYSHGEWSDAEGDYQRLVSTLDRAAQAFDRAIRAYRVDGNTAAVLRDTEEIAVTLARHMGFALGRLAGLQMRVEAAAPALRAALGRRGLLAAWHEIAAELERLEADPEPWSSVLDFDGLCLACASMVRAFGVHCTAGDDGRLLVDIPFRA